MDGWPSLRASRSLGASRSAAVNTRTRAAARALAHRSRLAPRLSPAQAQPPCRSLASPESQRLSLFGLAGTRPSPPRCFGGEGGLHVWGRAGCDGGGARGRGGGSSVGAADGVLVGEERDGVGAGELVDLEGSLLGARRHVPHVVQLPRDSRAGPRQPPLGPRD